MFMKRNVYVNQKYFIVTNYRQLVVATFLYSILECFFFISFFLSFSLISSHKYQQLRKRELFIAQNNNKNQFFLRESITEFELHLNSTKTTIAIRPHRIYTINSSC